ncbi:MAG: TonB-dependent receptor [Gallionella sp.]|nr:TonB-dependent receptor [Gallionella sp.]
MKHKYILGTLLCAVTSLVQAGNNALDEVVVTASRSEQHLNQTLQSTSVITQRDILESGATDVPSLLRNLAGVEVAQTGGIGSQSSLFLRGTNSTHTLVLLDGVRISAATTGATAIDQLMLDQVERIEVVRGNVSSLYGSEAIGGVVQIFTKRGSGAPAATVSAGYGSHATRRASAAFGGEINGATFHLGVSRLASDGISAINTTLAPSANPDSDGFDNTSVSARAGYAFNDNHRVEASVFRSLGKLQTDNAFGLPTDYDESDANLSKWSLATSNRLLEGWESRVNFAQGMDDLVSRSNGLKTSAYKTVSDQLAWQNTLNIGEQGILLIAVERLKQRVSSTTTFSADARSTNSLLAGYSADYGVHQVQVNVRQDRYSDFGSANTGLLGYGLRIGESLRMTATISTAFKAPTFNDMYYPLSWGYQGNPNLKPERASNLELGAHYGQGEVYVDGSLFQNRIRDLIAINSTFTTVENLDEALIEGVELVYGVKHDVLEIENAVTLQSPRNVKTGAILSRRAQTMNTLTVARRFDSGRVGFEWRSSGERKDGANTLVAYDVINLSVQWKLTPNFGLNARVDNLFGQDYMLVHQYNTLGRTVFVGLNYQQ